MTVYRFQDKDGRGPFKPGFSEKWLDDPKPNMDELVAWPLQFPEIFFYVQIMRTIYCGCGCSTVEQLKKWFSPSEEKRLRKFGYRAVAMTVDEILAQSDVQIVFRRNKPLRKSVKPFHLYELFP